MPLSSSKPKTLHRVARGLAVSGLAVVAITASLGLADDRLALQELIGKPLHGLTANQLELFEEGKVLFGLPILEEDGLGPILNKSNCRSCHEDAGPGAIAVTHFGELDDKDEFSALPGGSLFQLATVTAGCEEVIPPEANFTTVHLTPGMQGYGLVEAIPDAQISIYEDPTDSDGDGISGRVHWVQPAEDPTGPLRVGRFGWKSIIATVEHFSGDASKNELGFTNMLFPDENAPNGDMALLAACDDVADPEDHPDLEGFTFVDRITHYQRYIAPPPQTPRSGMSGELIFENIGCAKCHVTDTYITSNDPSLEGAIRNKPVKPYSDFLLHDMGILGDGLPQGNAFGNEFRTTPLMGLGNRLILLHDGRAAGGSFADRVTSAIGWHGPFGEGADSAAAFDALNAKDKDALFAFLQSLGRREFDMDSDRDLDVDDFGNFAACYGIGGPFTPDDPCAINDIDQDGDVDDVDFGYFVKAYDGVIGDCNCDGISDFSEILGGAPDEDGDGVPDDCVICVGDLNCDNVVNGGDLGLMLSFWGACQDCDGDLNGSGTVDGADIGLMLSNWGSCP